VLRLRERGKYRVKIEGSQTPQNEGKICGDSWRSFITDDGKQHIILSDGMGCGGNAALDSAMAVSLMKQMVKTGADYNSALRLVNSALLVKSGEESLATLDAAVVDLYSGKVDFHKAGAAATVLRRGRRAGCVEAVSSPAGILDGVSFEHSSLWLKEGDWVVLLSDGATAAGVEWIVQELEHYEGDDPAELSQKLTRAAHLRRTDGRRDDITVICALVEAESY
jgi:stage II sporulation protein E